jgi:hypothetical protein
VVPEHTPPPSPASEDGKTQTSTSLPENSLKIAEPLPGTVITDSVTVKGEGRAFENTILVAVVAGGKTLGREIVTTDAEVGQIGYFTTTVRITPVSEPTDGYVTIYTQSAKDGSIDQQASVNVHFEPPVGMTDTGRDAPEITLSPDKGKGGTQVMVTGKGFSPGSEVEIRLGGLSNGATEQPYARTIADTRGNISVEFTMPSTWPNSDPIVQPRVLVVASTPDFVEKATAEFAFEGAGQP